MVATYASERIDSVQGGTKPMCPTLFRNRIDKRYFKLSKSFVESWITSKKRTIASYSRLLSIRGMLAKDVELYFGQTPGESCGICSNCT